MKSVSSEQKQVHIIKVADAMVADQVKSRAKSNNDLFSTLHRNRIHQHIILPIIGNTSNTNPYLVHILHRKGCHLSIPPSLVIILLSIIALGSIIIIPIIAVLYAEFIAIIIFKCNGHKVYASLTPIVV
eukprot:769920_1